MRYCETPSILAREFVGLGSQALLHPTVFLMAAHRELSSVFETEHLQADLRGRSVRGGVLTLSSQGALFLIQTIATVVLGE